MGRLSPLGLNLSTGPELVTPKPELCRWPWPRGFYLNASSWFQGRGQPADPGRPDSKKRRGFRPDVRPRRCSLDSYILERTFGWVSEGGLHRCGHESYCALSASKPVSPRSDLSLGESVPNSIAVRIPSLWFPNPAEGPSARFELLCGVAGTPSRIRDSVRVADRLLCGQHLGLDPEMK